MHRDKIVLFGLGVALLLVAVALLPLSVAAQDATAEPQDPPADDMTMAGPLASAALLDVDGNALGQVTINQLADGLMMVQVSGNGMPPGFHGFHVHTTGVCDPSGDTPFSSAGGHLNPQGVDHPEHAGDLPILYVTAGGTAGMAVVTDRFTSDMLFDEDGSAIVVHGGANNYANIPERYGGPDSETLNAGDSGPRIACGVLEAGMPADMEMAPDEEAVG
jgi:Cu-Zn family superoxide dismutase